MSTVAFAVPILAGKAGAFRELATSDDPSEVRMREKVREIHGIDLSDPEAAGPAPEMVMDWSA